MRLRLPSRPSTVLGAAGLILEPGASLGRCRDSALLGRGRCRAGQGEYGTIKGRLVWGGSEIPPAKNLVEKGKAPKDPEVCAKDEPIPIRELVVDPKTKGVAYGFAYLVKPKGSNPEAVKALLAKSPKVELDQKNCEFIPYAQAIHQDQTLLIKSSDPVNHNVRYAAFSNSPFNQILAPKGELEVKLIAERRPIVVACDIHSWMKAYLMVFDHPFFAVTGAGRVVRDQGGPGRRAEPGALAGEGRLRQPGEGEGNARHRPRRRGDRRGGRHDQSVSGEVGRSPRSSASTSCHRGLNVASSSSPGRVQVRFARDASLPSAESPAGATVVETHHAPLSHRPRVAGHRHGRPSLRNRLRAHGEGWAGSVPADRRRGNAGLLRGLRHPTPVVNAPAGTPARPGTGHGRPRCTRRSTIATILPPCPERTEKR